MSENDGDMPGLVETSSETASAAGRTAVPGSETTPLSGTAPPHNDDDHEEDDDEEGWLEVESAPPVSPTCLFCPSQLPAAEVPAHCRQEHQLDLATLVTEHALDCFGYIRLVNFVRTTGVSAAELRTLPAASWADDKYMKPVLDCDPLLMIDVEDLAGLPERPAPAADDPSRHVVNYEGAYVTLSVAHYEQLQHQLAALRQQLQESRDCQEQLLQDMATMRGTMHQVLRLDEEDEAPTTMSAASAVGDSDSYFESYAHFGIHHEMLSDRVRTEAYRDAICRNALPCVRDRSVLDLGCGTAILSMFCARAGAAQVVGVDRSDVIYNAMDIVRENGLCDVVTLVKGRLEDMELPGGPDRRFDVIVSEWMGYFLLFEGMLDSVLYARDRLLADGGSLMPNRCTMSLVAVSDMERYDNLLSFWSDVYGFQMTCLRSEVIQEASVEVVPSSAVCSEPCLIKSLDLNTIKASDTEFTAPFSVTVTRAGPVTALVGYFDTHFDLPVAVEFSTGPQSTPTHWKQTVFYLERPVAAAAGDTIDGTLFCARDRKDPRSLRVTVTMGGKSQRYRVS